MQQMHGKAKARLAACIIMRLVTQMSESGTEPEDCHYTYWSDTLDILTFGF